MEKKNQNRHENGTIVLATDDGHEAYFDSIEEAYDDLLDRDFDLSLEEYIKILKGDGEVCSGEWHFVYGEDEKATAAYDQQHTEGEAYQASEELDSEITCSICGDTWVDGEDACKHFTATMIRLFRTAKGWSLRTLADKLGYKSHSLIAAWENGERQPKLASIKKVAKALEIDYIHLLK